MVYRVYVEKKPGLDHEAQTLKNDMTGLLGIEKLENVRLFLYGNGQYVAEKQVSEADGWTYMFIVPKYTASGEPITYVIDELEIEGYSKHIDGYDLFNTFVGEDSFPDPEPPQLPSFSPATGDNSNLPLWIGIFAASTIGMGILLFFVLRNKDKSSKDNRD